MANKILLTSFDTWLPHQQSNSSDDLLNEISKLNYTAPFLAFLRLLPVDIELASCAAIAKINELQPDAIICCGMAERRSQLTIESNATCGNTMLKTQVDLQQLVIGSNSIEISDDAGNFVCEGLYYSVLHYINECQLKINCIFVHVPILTKENLINIIADFNLIIYKFDAYNKLSTKIVEQ